MLILTIAQVPLGTLVHKVIATAKPEEPAEVAFQQHWVGARDYESSEEESGAETIFKSRLEVVILQPQVCTGPS